MMHGVRPRTSPCTPPLRSAYQRGEIRDIAEVLGPLGSQCWFERSWRAEGGKWRRYKSYLITAGSRVRSSRHVTVPP